MAAQKPAPLWDPKIVVSALRDAIRKFDPRVQARNPVMFVVEVTALAVTIIFARDFFGHRSGMVGFELQIALWLWFTVLFANFAEAMAEGRGKAQADNLRKTRTETKAKLFKDAAVTLVAATSLRRGDVVLVEAGDVIPGDGEVIEGIAAVNEAAITGESAPVIRESGDRSAVTGGTSVISDWIKVRITANPGETFLDRMIALVEGAERQKTPNEIALSILLAGLTIIFMLVCVSLYPFALYGGTVLSLPVLVALLVCLIPTTIGGLLSAIGIAGMDRLVQHNVLAMSGRAVEAAGDVDTLLLDKTGTITLGNRMATEFIPASGVALEELADAAQLASLADETPEGRSITALAKRQFNLRGRELAEKDAHFIPFSAQTRMSGVDLGDRRIRKGAADQVIKFVKDSGGQTPADLAGIIDRISRQGATPLLVADGARVLGVIHLKDAGVLPRSRALFAHWIDVELHDITEVGEDRLAADIERRGRELFDALAADPNAGRDADFAVLNSRLDDLIAINQAAMFRADSRASRLGDRVTYEFAAALGLLLLIGAALSLTLAWAIARPLDELAERLRALGARAGHPRVGTQNLAELDAVAQEFNKMAERLEEFDRLNVGRLLYEKDKTEAIVESLDDGIVLLDPGGIVAHINETAALIVAVDRAGALGSSFDDLDSNHPHYLKVRAALRGGGASLAQSPIEIALEVRGREHFYMPKALPLRKSTGESFGTLVTLQDVTYLRDKDRARAALLARLVRELETPLRSLARAADLLQQRDGRLDAQQRGLVETLREDVADLSRKLGELLKGA